VRGDDVLVQSRLTSFGVIDGGVETVYRALRDRVGLQGTIVVPTYRLGAPADEVYDRSASPSLEVGVLSEYVRTLPEAVRSNCPFHSHAAVGPKAYLLESASGEASFGPGSDFALLHDNGFINLMLGCNFRTAGTFVVHVTAMAGNIPYRGWAEFARKRRSADGRVTSMVCCYYRREDLDVEEDLEIVEVALRAAGHLHERPCLYGKSMLVSLADIQAIELDMLASDPRAIQAKTTVP
ncbi:MAG: AAC(3) family N-acetyltransferase, partial [Xanthobacteraceae bacterium]